MPAEQIAFKVFSGAALILILLPLPWHWQARNYGTLLYIGWTFFGILMYFVNAIVWTGNLENPAPVWCDISAKLAMGLGVALPAVSLCINRRLYNIATMKHASSSPQEKRNQAIIDFGIGLGLPFLVMALHYVVQGHRFNIIEDVGCTPTTYAAPLVIPLVLMWPILLGFTSMVYGLLAIHAFMKQRRNFSSMLSSGQSHMNVSRYLRLMALAGTDILLDLPLSMYITWSNLKHGLLPWHSWADVHYNFSNVVFVPRATLEAIPGAWPALTVNRWALPVAGILFFAFFGLAGESKAAYMRAYERLTGPLRRVRGLLPLRNSNTNAKSVAPTPIASSLKSPLVRNERKRDIDVESAFEQSEKAHEDYASLHSVVQDTFPLPSPSYTTQLHASGLLAPGSPEKEHTPHLPQDPHGDTNVSPSYSLSFESQSLPDNFIRHSVG